MRVGRLLLYGMIFGDTFRTRSAQIYAPDGPSCMVPERTTVCTARQSERYVQSASMLPASIHRSSDAVFWFHGSPDGLAGCTAWGMATYDCTCGTVRTCS